MAGEDRADLAGITDRRVAELIKSMCRPAGAKAGLAFTIPDDPTRELVTRLAELVCVYATLQANGGTPPAPGEVPWPAVEANVANMLRLLEFNRITS